MPDLVVVFPQLMIRGQIGKRIDDINLTQSFTALVPNLDEMAEVMLELHKNAACNVRKLNNVQYADTCWKVVP